MKSPLDSYIIQLLKPLVRFCYRRGIKIQQLTEWVKIVLIESAQEDLEFRGEEANVSRLSVSTGLHRRDIIRLWQQKGQQKSGDTIVIKIVGQWASNKKFLNASGKPRLLTFEGKDSEFAKLVSSVTQDINPYTILFELERAEIVEKTAKGLSLKKSVFQPTSKDTTAGIELLANDISDFVKGVEQNIFSPEPIANLHIKTEYDNIPTEALPKIRKTLLAEGDLFQKKMRQYLSGFDRDFNPLVKGGGSARVAVGTFSFTEIANSPKETES